MNKHDYYKKLSKAKGPKGGWDPAEYKRGEADAYQKAPVKLEEEYILPIETHNPMEMHAIIANWESDDKVIVYTKTQGPKDTQDAVVQAFKLPAANVKVIAEFVGGGFGSALRTWPHEIATIIAAKKSKPTGKAYAKPRPDVYHGWLSPLCMAKDRHWCYS